MMGWFIVTRAILVRTLFGLHGVFSIWLLAVVTEDATKWYMTTGGVWQVVVKRLV